MWTWLLMVRKAGDDAKQAPEATRSLAWVLGSLDPTKDKPSAWSVDFWNVVVGGEGGQKLSSTLCHVIATTDATPMQLLQSADTS